MIRLSRPPLIATSLALVVLLLAALAPAVATAADEQRTIVATGSAQSKPRPADRKDEESIREAVENAEADALPRAVAEARDYAADLAKAGRVKLGSLISIANGQQGYPFLYGPQNGTFGPGRYCGQVPNSKRVTQPNGGVRTVRTKGTHRSCRVPSRITVTITLTFAIDS